MSLVCQVALGLLARKYNQSLGTLFGGNMRLGSIVRYHYYDDNTHHGWGIVTSVNRVDPNRPFFFVSWVKDANEYGKKLNNTWYHPSRLVTICE